MADDKCGTSGVCKICNNNSSKYCCPRCSVMFCSVDCYRSKIHSDCSETFYRECVTEQLASQSGNETSKKTMMEILSRLNAEVGDRLEDDNHASEMESNVDSDDNSVAEDLADRLKDVDLEDSESVWHALTDDEKKEFESLLQTGKVMDMLPVWKPWWTYNKGSKLVQEVDKLKDDLAEMDAVFKSCPVIASNIQEFTCISKQKPAECVKYNLINVLSAYLYTVRLFNGEHFSSALEAVSCLISICNNMKSVINYEDALSAINSVIQECHKNPSMISHDDNIANLNYDIICLLRGPDKDHRSFYINCALSDLHRLVTEAKLCAKSQKDLKKKKDGEKKAFSKRFPEGGVSSLPEISTVKLKTYSKKIEYYLSYVKSYSSDLTASILGFDTNKIF